MLVNIFCTLLKASNSAQISPHGITLYRINTFLFWESAARTQIMGGIKQEQSDASQQPKASQTADQPPEEVSTAAADQSGPDLNQFNLIF